MGAPVRRGPLGQMHPSRKVLATSMPTAKAIHTGDINSSQDPYPTSLSPAIVQTDLRYLLQQNKTKVNKTNAVFEVWFNIVTWWVMTDFDSNWRVPKPVDIRRGVPLIQGQVSVHPTPFGKPTMVDAGLPRTSLRVGSA